MKTSLLRLCAGVLLVATFVFIQTSNSSNAVILYHAKNQFGPVWVHDVEGIRTLTFVPDSRIYQSRMKLDQPDAIQIEYIKMLFGSLYLSNSPKDILLTGLGGGTFAKALNTAFPYAKLDIVEINPLIPPIAKRYFLFEPNENTKINVTDGYVFIQEAPASKYDLVVLDAFDKDYIPPPFLTEAFVSNVKRILKPNGVVVVNTFKDTRFSEIESKLYKEGFSSFFELTNEVSKVIIARKGHLPSLGEIKARSKRWAFTLHRVGIDANWLADKFSQPK